MKLRIIFILSFILSCQTVFADVAQSPQAQQSATTYQNIDYQDCTKIFNIDKEKLFYLSIGAINANKFKLEEIQTQNGYLIFSTGKNKYLATVAGIDNGNSILKVTPCNNLYYFQPGIITNIYKYIDLNKDTELR
jgi:hypothetical protein